jgi:hypothetical protein
MPNESNDIGGTMICGEYMDLMINNPIAIERSKFTKYMSPMTQVIRILTKFTAT